MARRARSGVDQVKILQLWIHECADRRDMPDGGHAANRKARDRAHGMGGGTTKRFAHKRGCLGRINLIAARSDEQHQIAAVLARENDRFGDLINITPCYIRRLLRRARV